MKFNASSIPEELKRHKQWVCWKSVRKGDKSSKFPINPNNSMAASVTDPETWGTFDQAVCTSQQNDFDGIGFVFTRSDPFVGIDLDHCLKGDTGDVIDILESFHSYAEYSPSGDGLHIIFKGRLPEGFKHKNGWLEIYEQDRFFTVTGHGYGRFAELEIASNQEAIQVFCEKFMGQQCLATSHRIEPPNAAISPEEIDARIRLARENPVFKALWDGDVTDYKSPSEADLALACKLAYWMAGDETAIEGAMLRSGLVRNKWSRSDGTYGTYLDRTIQRAIQMNTVYIQEHKPQTAQETPMSGNAQIETLMKPCRDIELFHDPYMKGYVTYPHGEDGNKTAPLDSGDFSSWLKYTYYRNVSKPADDSQVNKAIDLLKYEAIYDCPEKMVHKRVAMLDGKVYIDMARDGRAVEISASGWKLVSKPPVKFIASSGMASLPDPERGGSLDQLKELINLPDDDSFKLVVGWVLQAMNPEGQYPALILQGEQGTAKTWTTKVLRSLTDPSEVPTRSLPKSEQDLMVSASSSWVMAYDNLSNISGHSDALCRLATGAGFTKRKLYADTEEVMINVKRPIILNGIGQLAVRHDLIDRTIVINLPIIDKTKRKPEQVLDKQLKEAIPALLGCLYDAISTGLKNIDTVDASDFPRMADFARWVIACEPGLPWAAGEFMEAYDGNRAGAVEEAINSDPVCIAIVQLMRGKDVWTGTHTDLLEALESTKKHSARFDQTLPTNPSLLSRKLTESTAFLRESGLRVNKLARGKQRTIEITHDADVMSDDNDRDPKVPSHLETSPQGGIVGHDGSVSDYLS